jgi:hypothetical protein
MLDSLAVKQDFRLLKGCALRYGMAEWQLKTPDVRPDRH